MHFKNYFIRCVLEATTLSLWLNIFVLFDRETWGYFTIITIVAGTVLYYFYKFYSHKENWWYCVGLGFFITTNVPVPINPTHPVLRTYFIIFCIYGIFATATFNSFFMSTITNPIKYNQISTIESLINNSMEIYAENETVPLYNTCNSQVMN